MVKLYTQLQYALNVLESNLHHMQAKYVAAVVDANLNLGKLIFGTVIVKFLQP